MEYQEALNFLDYLNKDPSRLIFEDELTQIYNRRFLFSYFNSKVTWEELDDRPLSLIMVDVDNFKETNDTYGHQVGDQVLTWVAAMLQESAGEDGLAVRYAGDEFILLLPYCENDSALQRGEALLKRFHDEPFQLEGHGPIDITLSMGIATAPDDATSSKHLIQQADMALYYAKKAGRDRLANAGEVGPEDVFSKKAIYLLDEIRLVGREKQMSQMADALRQFLQRQSRFILVEGAPGLGKSEFLETIQRNLARTRIEQVKVSGVPQEMFRPYYLVTNILSVILGRREDKGSEIFDDMGVKELSYLSHLLPQLGKSGEDGAEENESQQREGIFNTLVHVLPRAVHNRPLIILIDDMHYADEGTLILLKRMIQRGDVPLFICGTCTETGDGGAQQGSPLRDFSETYGDELPISRIPLTPLSGSDIDKLIQSIFPKVRLPGNFEAELAEITQGNPLFLSEILRKLVLDQKITLSGQHWTIHPLEKDYLPRSLEDIVAEKIAALNEEDRQLLDRASAFGEDVTLSMLMGASERTMEAKVLEFIDQAAEQGLLSSDFEMNDETVRFLGKRILEITYGRMDPQKKEQLHGHIGNYQESLYHRRLLPSAASLAYHFRRSADPVKAANYEQLQAAANRRVFNAEEALSYTGDWHERASGGEEPLDPADLPAIPVVIRHLMSAVRNNRLYPPGSKSIVSANRQLHEAVSRVLERNRHLSLFQNKGALIVNGQRADISEFRVIAQGWLQLMGRFVLRGIRFRRGVTEQEVEVVTESLAGSPLQLYDEGHWKRFVSEKDLTHIDLRQVRYAIKGQIDESGKQLEAAKLSESAEIRVQKYKHVPQILRGLLSAARAGKLYPVNSQAFTAYVDRFMNALRGFFAAQPALSLSQVGNSLLINGERVDTSEYRPLAEGFLKFLNFMGLGSISFLPRTNSRELKTFFGALGGLSGAGADRKYWERLASEHYLKGILFDRHLYESWVADSVQGSGSGTESAAAVYREQPSDVTTAVPAEDQPIPDEDFGAFLGELPNRIHELLLSGEEDAVGEMIGRLFHGLGEREPVLRQKIPEACREVLEPLTLSLRYEFIKRLADPLAAAFADEEGEEILLEMGTLLRQLSTNLIEFADYAGAGRVLSQMQKRHRELKEANDPRAQTVSKLLARKPEPALEQILLEDLKSADSQRQRNAALLLAGMGEPAVAFLARVIKEEDQYRVRKIAALLLGEHQPTAVDVLRRELAREIDWEERRRILEVIDLLTRNVKTEVIHGLADGSPQVRRAALRLIERLKDHQMVPLLLEYARGQMPEKAVDAIKTVAKLGPPGVSEDLVGILESSNNRDVQIACCRALGQIGDPGAVQALTGILLPRRVWFIRRKRHPQLREAAAVALAQVPRPRTDEVFSSLVEDRDPVVREIARGAVLSSAAPDLKPTG